MLIIDDVLAAPLRGLLFAFKEIEKAVRKEREAEEKAALAELSALHQRFEAGALSEAEFAHEEAGLLRKLDDLQGRKDDDGNGDENSERT